LVNLGKVGDGPDGRDGRAMVRPMLDHPDQCCSRFIFELPCPRIGWSSGKKNPATPRPAAAENGPHVGSPSRNDVGRLLCEGGGSTAQAILSLGCKSLPPRSQNGNVEL
jgi:hypothetical protein